MKVATSNIDLTELCVPFSCNDFFVFVEIKWRCAFTKYTTQKFITKSQSTSVSCEKPLEMYF